MSYEFFGYWKPVRDEASAIASIRMAGLPVLLAGANAAVAALVSFVQPERDAGLIATAAAMAVALTLVAFRLRAGHAGWFPLAVAVFAVFLMLGAAVSYGELQSRALTLAEIGESVSQWIVTLICAILAANGFAGWRWLRSHRVAMTF